MRGRWAPWRARVGVPSPISALTSVDGVPISARDRGRADGRANRAVKSCPTRRGWPPYHGRATRASSAHLLSSSWPVLHARPDAADGQGARRRSCELSVMLCARSISPGWFPSSALTFVRRCACVCTLNAPRCVAVSLFVFDRGTCSEFFAIVLVLSLCPFDAEKFILSRRCTWVLANPVKHAAKWPKAARPTHTHNRG